MAYVCIYELQGLHRTKMGGGRRRRQGCSSAAAAHQSFSRHERKIGSTLQKLRAPLPPCTHPLTRACKAVWNMVEEFAACSTPVEPAPRRRRMNNPPSMRNHMRPHAANARRKEPVKRHRLHTWSHGRAVLARVRTERVVDPSRYRCRDRHRVLLRAHAARRLGHTAETKGMPN